MESATTLESGVQGGAGRGSGAVRPATPAAVVSRLSPPLRLPGGHFAAGALFLALGAVGLAWIAPDLAAGSFLTPRVVAITHLFTLGWITLSIFGALYQFLPVALSEAIRWPGVAHVTLGLFAPGLLAFAYGLTFGGAGYVVVGGSLLGAAVVLFSVNMTATLVRASRRDLTWWSLAAATFYLLLTALLGLALAVNLGSGFMGGGRWAALGVHFHLALGGWVLMVIIGVGHRLLPMFLLSHGADERWGRVAAWFVAIGVAWLVLFHHAPPALAQWVPALLIAAGLGAFLVQAASFYRHRVKPRLDPGLRLAAGALVLLFAGLILGGWNMVTGWSPPTLITGYALAVILGVSLFVAAHYYKIVPFLVWYHRFGPLAGRRPVPQVSELYSARYATVATGLMGAGYAGMVGAVLGGSGDGARIAAFVGAAGVAVLVVQMTILSRRRP